MNKDTNRRETSIALIISIIVHVLLFLVIILIALPESEHEAFQKDTPQELLVELQDDYTQPVPEENPWVAMDTTPPSQELVEAPEFPVDSFPEQSESPVDERAELPEKPIEAPPEPEQDIVAEKPKAQDDPIDINQDSFDDIVALATQILEETEQPEEKIVELPKKPEKKKDTPLPAQSLQYTPPVPVQKLPTLAQVTQGFMEHMNQQSTMAVSSNNRGQASIDQVKHMNYCQKIIGCLVTSYSMHRNRAPKTPTSNRLCVNMSLAGSGQIHAINVVQSSGNPSLDQFVVTMFKDASTSFPPVPASFTQKPYPLPMFNIDSIESFQSARGWYIDNKG